MNACTYCDRPFNPAHHGTSMTKDHVIPRSLMLMLPGTFMRDNIVPACGTCNGLKGAMMPNAIRAMANEHRNRATLLDRMADKVDELIQERGLMPLLNGDDDGQG